LSQSLLLLQAAYDASGEEIKVINKAHITAKRRNIPGKLKLIIRLKLDIRILAQNIKPQGYR
jgi:hypothetical protein